MEELKTQNEQLIQEGLIPNPLGNDIESEAQTDVTLPPVSPPLNLENSSSAETQNIKPAETPSQAQSISGGLGIPGIKLKIGGSGDDVNSSASKEESSIIPLPASDAPKIKIPGLQDAGVEQLNSDNNIKSAEKPTPEVNKIHIGIFQAGDLAQQANKKVEPEKKDELLEKVEEVKQEKKSSIHELFKNYQPSFIKKKPTVMEQLNRAKRVVKTNFRFIFLAITVTAIGIYSLQFFNPNVHNFSNYRNIAIGFYYKYTRHIINLPATQPIMRGLLTTQSGADIYNEPVEETGAVVAETPVEEPETLVDQNLAKDRFSLGPVPGSMDFIIASSQDFEVQQQKLKEQQIALEEEQRKEKEKEIARKSKLNAFLNRNVTELPAVTIEEKKKSEEEVRKEKEKKMEEERLNAKKEIVAGILNKYTFILPGEEPKLIVETPKTETPKTDPVKPNDTKVAIVTPKINETPKWGKSPEEIEKEKIEAKKLQDLLNATKPKTNTGTVIEPKKPTKGELMVAAQKALEEKKKEELKKKVGDILNKYTFTPPTTKTGSTIKNTPDLTSAPEEDPEKTKIRKEKIKTYLLKYFNIK